MGLTLPFIQWNTAKLTIKVSESEYEEAVVNFRQTLYKALADVENALSALTHYQEESVQLELALETAKKAEQLSEVRYRAGATGVQALAGSAGTAQKRRGYPGGKQTEPPEKPYDAVSGPWWGYGERCEMKLMNVGKTVPDPGS